MHEIMNDSKVGVLPTVAFFITFQFLAVFLTLNLFISVVVAYTQKADHEKWEKAQDPNSENPGREFLHVSPSVSYYSIFTICRNGVVGHR